MTGAVCMAYVLFDAMQAQQKGLLKIPVSLKYIGTGTEYIYMYSTNHVYLHRPNAFGFWQTRLHLCYETLKRISNFSELV